MAGKIFCIGLNKTGTVSLHEALTLLGYDSLHWGGPEVRQAVERAIAEGAPMLRYLDASLEAFSDILPIATHFDLADEQYPGSRFVLTVRRLESWLESRRRHVLRNQEQQARGEYHGVFLEVDLAGWEQEFVAHRVRVERYFADRPDDLLVIDITAGAGWEPLCEFLGRPVPDAPFPWENRASPDGNGVE